MKRSASRHRLVRVALKSATIPGHPETQESPTPADELAKGIERHVSAQLELSSVFSREARNILPEPVRRLEVTFHSASFRVEVRQNGEPDISTPTAAVQGRLNFDLLLTCKIAAGECISLRKRLGA